MEEDTEVTWYQVCSLLMMGGTLLLTGYQSWKFHHFESKCCVKEGGGNCWEVAVDSETSTEITTQPKQ